MTECFTCGHEYDKAFTVTTHQGRTHSFDSMECAIHAISPSCRKCGVKVIGHGVEVDGVVFCCSHCARDMSDAELTDSA